MASWNGDYGFLLQNLIVKDFKIRYRHMSLGVFWSILNPLVMMAVFTFIFQSVFVNTTIAHYSIYILCGLLPFNFYQQGSASGANSIVDNAGLIKRIPVPREIVPIASVLSNCLHLGINILLLVAISIGAGLAVSFNWIWIPIIWFLLVVFVCGLSLLLSGISLRIRDTRYLLESVNTVMFWLVPIFYSPAIIPEKYRGLYNMNPITVVVEAQRRILILGQAPGEGQIVTLFFVSTITFALGWFVFGRLKKGFYNYL